ncbi:tetratricopeptide repeat protein [Kitasatospora sp. NPDC057692]|uniref:tetratricopeptide repeat protein n=1 Tax=Kitasatospora sp. NPDC057692 TaxID=3346215 RepID=UPI0036AD6F06
MRERRHGRLMVIVACLGALTAAPAVVLALGITGPWTVAAVSAAAAGAVALLGLWQERYRQAFKAADDDRARVLNGALVRADGSLLRVRDAADPVLLGVHPALALQPEEGAIDRVPAYVPRDADAELRESLARGGFVLLVGDSTAGKSRSAWEAMRATLGDHLLLAPKDREALPAIVALAARERRCVLWLNDLEGYLGPGGLRREDLGRLFGAGGHHRVVLATLRTAEEALLTGEDDDRGAPKQAAEVVRQAHRVYLPRLFSAAETERARLRAWDRRIESALTLGGGYGLAEYLAAGPELLRLWQDAWSPNTSAHAPGHPRAAALVTAAVDVRRAGHSASMPRALVEAAHTYYLERSGGDRLRPEPLDEAWEWATRPRRATTALLQPSGDHVRVFDYLLDVTQRAAGPADPVPEPVVRLIVTGADPAEAERAAATAYAQGRYELAVVGWRRAAAVPGPEALNSRNNAARALRRLGRLPQALAEHRAVAAARTDTLGPTHPDTLIVRDNLANVLRDLGRVEEAEAEHRAVLGLLTEVRGPDDAFTLFSRDNHAVALREMGRAAEAEAEHRAVLEIRERALEADHPDTLRTRHHLALALRSQGRSAEAGALLASVVAARTRVLGPGHPDTAAAATDLAAST